MLKKVVNGLLVSSMLMGASGALASPGNDNFSSATTINVNQTHTGVLNKSSDKDFYTFNVSKAGNVQIGIPNKSGASWQAFIYDENGELFDRFYTTSGDLANGNSVMSIGLPAGKYYMHIETYSYGAINTPYSFKVSYEQSEFFEKESNDTVSLANTISLNKTYKGTLATLSDDDFYSFSLKEAGNVNLSMPNKSGMPYTLKVYDSKGTLYDISYTDSRDLATGSTVIPLGLPAGKYYVQIETNSPNSIDTPYSFQAAFSKSSFYEKELNDTLSSATPLSFNYKYTGSLHDMSEKDFYKFTLNKTSNVTLSVLNQEKKGWTAFVYDAKGERILKTLHTSTSFSSKNHVEKLQTKLNAGTYYIRFITRSYDSVNSPYYFSITTKQFPDVALSHWAHNDITFLSSKGIISGFKDGSFKPNNNVTKAQAAMMITRVLKLNTSNVKNPNFKDVSTKHSAYASIAAVTNAGIFPKSTNFNPDAPLTRQEMAMALVEAYDLTGTYTGKITDVSDSKTLHYVKILAGNKVTYINADGTFKPKGTVTRAQFSAFFARILDSQFKQ